MEYLKKEQYYIDLYDLLTIKDCLNVVKTFKEIYQKMLKDEKLKDKPKEDILKSANYALNWQLFGVKASRCQHKEKRIEEMIEDDRKKQDFYDNVSEPSVLCKTCDKRLFSETKILEDYMNEPMRVLFFFPCKTCETKQGVYNTGEEFESKQKICPKCGKELTEKHKVKDKGKGKIITWIKICSSCKYTETIVDDFEKSHAEFEKEQQTDKELLGKYREEFCLTKEKAEEYLETIEAMKYGSEVFEEEKQKFDNIAYQTTIQLKRLTIVDLEKLLTEPLEKMQFIKFSLGSPDIKQFVIVPFTTQDADSSRKGRDSIVALEKLLKPVLEETNWRLEANSISYRLGFVSGQLKGYEQEEDLLELLGMKKEEEPKQIDYERDRKYGHNNLVQLMRMAGKHKGIENMRKRRLEKEPDGFFLESTEGPYSCGICGETTPGNKIWWNLDGLRCVDCWRNIQEGVIPSLGYRYNNEDAFQDWQLNSDFSLHSSTVKKLKREDLLHGRELKRQDGTIYLTIYLVEENKEFLKRYPKIPKMKVEWKMKDDKGNDVKF